MAGIDLILIGSILLLVALIGFFAGEETALTSANRINIEHLAAAGNRRAQLVQRLLASSERFLGTTLVGTNLAHASVITLADILIARHVSSERLVTVLNAVVMTPLILVVGEMFPKSLGRLHANAISMAGARALHVCERLFYPLVLVVGRLSRVLAGWLGPGTAVTAHQLTRADLREVAELAAEEGLVPSSAGDMLRTVFELDSKPVASVMIPLVDVVSLPISATVAAAEELAVRTGVSRFPVYEHRVDDIIGIIDVRKMLYEQEGGDPAVATATSFGERSLRDFCQYASLFIPETKSVGTLLHELRFEAMPMAIVVDEHGGVVGLVTVEDLIEELVGEIQDERDRQRLAVRQVGESLYECDGKLELRELEEHLKVEVERAGFETTAGLVLKLAGRIPEQGDRFYFQGYEIEVLQMHKRRIARLRFRRLPKRALHTRE